MSSFVPAKTPDDIFELLNPSGDGALKREELRIALVQMKAPVDAEVLDSMMRYLDKDGDGKISKHDFTELWRTHQSGQGGFAFTMFASMMHFFAGAGDGRERMTGTPTEILFDTLDQDARGKIDAEEFIALVVVAGLLSKSILQTRRLLRHLGIDKDDNSDIDIFEFEILMKAMAEKLCRDESELCISLTEAINTKLPGEDE